MSVENVKMFYEAVSKDEDLKQKFVELSQKYQGQPMDEAKATSLMEQEALPLAKQMGYSFTMHDLKTYEQDMKQAKNGCEVSDEEMQAVVGGHMMCWMIGNGTTGGFCLIFGLDSNGNASCRFYGSSLA